MNKKKHVKMPPKKGLFTSSNPSKTMTCCEQAGESIIYEPLYCTCCSYLNRFYIYLYCVRCSWFASREKNNNKTAGFH